MGLLLLVVSVVLRRRGVHTRGLFLAGLLAVTLSLVSAGACGWLVLRTAQVSGREEARHDRVERRFDRAFDAAGRAPPPSPSTAPLGDSEQGARGGDAGAGVGADFPPDVRPRRERNSQ
jgi:hypothetical protein